MFAHQDRIGIVVLVYTHRHKAVIRLSFSFFSFPVMALLAGSAVTGQIEFHPWQQLLVLLWQFGLIFYGFVNFVVSFSTIGVNLTWSKVWKSPTVLYQEKWISTRYHLIPDVPSIIGTLSFMLLTYISPSFLTSYPSTVLVRNKLKVYYFVLEETRTRQKWGEPGYSLSLSTSGSFTLIQWPIQPPCLPRL